MYFVWYEQGGIAYAPYITLYRLRAADNGLERLALRPQFGDCQAVDDLLDGKPPPPPPPPPPNPDLVCTFSHPVRSIDTAKDLPDAINGDLLAHFAPQRLGERDGPMTANDTRATGSPSRTFIRAGQAGDLWFVWYRHFKAANAPGGTVIEKQIVLYRLPDANGRAVPVAKEMDVTARGMPGLCAHTDDMLDGKFRMPPDVDTNW